LTIVRNGGGNGMVMTKTADACIRTKSERNYEVIYVRPMEKRLQKMANTMSFV
jgi:tRNA G37 N-methylase TrmD